MFRKLKEQIWPCVPEVQMTSRARRYLLIVTFYAYAMAVGLLTHPTWFQTANFQFVIDMVPFQLFMWGIIHCIVGTVALIAARQGSGSYAYRALIAAFVVVGLWACGFVWSWYVGLTTGTKAPWSGAVVYTSMALTHLVQARQPIRSPFDPIVRSVERDG